MAEQRQHNEFDELQRQLSEFTPTAGRLNREKFLFRAGQESVRAGQTRDGRAGLPWSISTAVLAVLSGCLAWQLFQIDQPRIVEQIRYINKTIDQPLETDQMPGAQNLATSVAAWPATAQPRAIAKERLMRDHYLNQRRVALSIGLDALAGPLSTGHTESLSHSSFRELKVNLNLLEFDAADGNGPDLRRTMKPARQGES